MICLICRQAEIVEGLTSISFERGEMRLMVSDVPARVCPSCRDASVDEAVAVQLLRVAKKMFDAGTVEDAIQYSNLP